MAAGAIAGAMASTVIVFGLGRIGGRLVPEAALLVGIVFNAFAAGVITLLKMMVPPEQASRLLYWLLGAVGYERPGTLALGAGLVLAAAGTLTALSAWLNLLTLGDEEAATLGLDVRRARAAIFFAASAATGSGTWTRCSRSSPARTTPSSSTTVRRRWYSRSAPPRRERGSPSRGGS